MSEEENVNWYLLAAQWQRFFREEPVHGAASFLRAFTYAVKWFMQKFAGSLTLLEESTLAWAAKTAKLVMPQSETMLNAKEWEWFLDTLCGDLAHEDKAVGTEIAGVTVSEFLEALGRRGRKLLQWPELAKVVVWSPKPVGLGLPVGQEFTLNLFLAPWPQVFTLVAAAGGENVGVPGDPATYWQSVTSSDPVENPPWSAPPAH